MNNVGRKTKVEGNRENGKALWFVFKTLLPSYQCFQTGVTHFMFLLLCLHPFPCCAQHTHSHPIPKDSLCWWQYLFSLTSLTNQLSLSFHSSTLPRPNICMHTKHTHNLSCYRAKCKLSLLPVTGQVWTVQWRYAPNAASCTHAGDTSL